MTAADHRVQRVKMESPLNARCPLSASYDVAPKLNTSERASRVFPSACSGDMYDGVPTTAPSRVPVDSLVCVCRERGNTEIKQFRAGLGDQHVRGFQIDELRRFARGEAYDEQPMPGLDSEALDFRAASESFAPIRRLRRTDLHTLRLVTAHQGRNVPTVGGMLLFGESRERHFPDAWIQAGRFHGVDKSRIVDGTEIHAHLIRAVEDAIAFVEKHALHGADIGNVRRRERWSIPPIAVREAVVNAVVHADYAQRGAPLWPFEASSTAGRMRSGLSNAALSELVLFEHSSLVGCRFERHSGIKRVPGASQPARPFLESRRARALTSSTSRLSAMSSGMAGQIGEVASLGQPGRKTIPSGSSPAGIVRTTIPRLMSMTEMVSSPMLAA